MISSQLGTSGPTQCLHERRGVQPVALFGGAVLLSDPRDRLRRFVQVVRGPPESVVQCLIGAGLALAQLLDLGVTGSQGTAPARADGGGVNVTTNGRETVRLVQLRDEVVVH